MECLAQIKQEIIFMIEIKNLRAPHPIFAIENAGYNEYGI